MNDVRLQVEEVVEPTNMKQQTVDFQSIEIFRASNSDEDQQQVLFEIIHSKRDPEEQIIRKIEECLNNGAQINVQSSRGKTVLHIAVDKDYKDLVKFLLNRQGVKTDIRNEDGKTALDLAKDLNKQDIIQIFESFSEQVENINAAKQSPIQSPSKKKKFTSADAAKYSKNFKSDFKDVFYSKSGSAHVLHGNIYQLKLLMLFLKRALRKNYEFNLGTEVDDAEKFDDIVFKYKNGEDKIRFVQVKHKQDECKKITANDLLTNKDGDFSLQKYFISYRNINKNYKFSVIQPKDFILYTNIDFSYDNLTNSSIKVEQIKDRDDIFDVRKPDKYMARYKLIIPKEHELYEKLRETSDQYLLAKTLAHHISEGKKLELRSEIFKLYHGPLCEKVLDISTEETKNKGEKKVKKRYAKFRDDFLDGSNLSDEIRNFRNTLQSALGKNEDANGFSVLLQGSRLTVVEKFGKVFNLGSNPMISDPREFAKKIVEIIDKDLENNIISIPRNSAIIQSNIDKLAGHVLVQTEEKQDQEQAIIFTKTFFDDANSLSGNLRQFKVALESELSLDQLKRLKFKISNFNTCEETPEGKLLYSKPMLPNDKIEDGEVDSFFNELLFVVNQPNEVELGDIITREIGDSSQFNLLNADLVSDSFQREMLDWFKAKGKEKGKGGVWLDAERGEKLFDSIGQKVNGLITVGLSLANLEELQEYDVKFVKNDMFNHLETFLNTQYTSKQILHIVPQNETILSAINVEGALKDLKQKQGFMQYQKHDSYICMRLGALLQPKLQKCVMNSFESASSYNLLIIDCASYTAEDKVQVTKSIYEKLSEILSKTSTNKKIIFLAKKDNVLVKQFAIHLKYEYTDNIGFNDLTPESKNKLLEKEVEFQGKKISLNKLMYESDEHVKDIIDVETLVKLIKSEEISIGSKIGNLGELNYYYIERKLRQETIKKDKIEQHLRKGGTDLDLFVVSGTYSGLEGNRNIYTFDDAESAGHKFEELCGQNRESNIHWLKNDSNILFWYKSFGSLAQILNKTGDKKSPVLIEEDKLIRENNIVIISNAAGMGKSTVLTSLSMKLKENNHSLWVIRINLNDYTDVLEDELNNRKAQKSKFNNQNVNEAINFLLNDLLASQEQTKVKTKLENELLKNSFNSNGKIALLFDGFDEISPDYKEIVLDLLQSLRKSKVEKMFITTRLNMRDELKKALGVFSHELETLSMEDQIDFLNKFWIKELNLKNLRPEYTERLNVYAQSVIEKLSKLIDDKENKFISFPLHTRMIAELFKDNQQETQIDWQGCKEFLASEEAKPNLPDNFSIFDLYEHFVHRKFYEFYLQDKLDRTLSKVGAKELAKKEFELFKKEHELLALNAFFSRKQLDKLLSNKETKHIKTLISGKLRSGKYNKGIVEIAGNKLHFIHRSFAQYFVSNSVYNWLEQSKKKDLILVDVLIEQDYQVIQRFFDQKLKREPIDQRNKIVSSLKSLIEEKYDYDYDLFEKIVPLLRHVSYLNMLLDEFSYYPPKPFIELFIEDLNKEDIQIIFNAMGDRKFKILQEWWKYILDECDYEEVADKIDSYIDILGRDTLQEPLSDILDDIPSAYPSDHDSDGNSVTSQDAEADLYCNGDAYTLTMIKNELKQKYVDKFERDNIPWLDLLSNSSDVSNCDSMSEDSSNL